VHQPIDAIKAVMAGADAVQLVSALLIHGPGRLKTIRDGFERWADQHNYESLRQMRGCANLARCANPHRFERGNYVEILRSGRQSAGRAGGH
jgi:dihydroorotate dehydrogenase (fumarate)